MGERKVLNKYYPPDFDPAKIPKRKQLKNLQMKVRMMLPMSIRCNTCGTYMYKGTKFNCRKEDVQDDTYLGLMKFRFYFKCTKCSAELVMKTDPKNSDYEMEFGASRNFEPWREADEVKEAAKKQREEEEMGDSMKALENRTMDSKIEMDILASLDEVKSLRSRQEGIDQDALLEALKRRAQVEATEQRTEQELDEEDEKLIKSIVFRNSAQYVKRLEDDDDEENKAEGGQGSSHHFEGGRHPTGNQRSEGEEDRLAKRPKVVGADEDFSAVTENRGQDVQGKLPAVVVQGGLVKDDPETQRPAFRVKPLAVGFVVKSKGGVRASSNNPGDAEGAGNAVSPTADKHAASGGGSGDGGSEVKAPVRSQLQPSQATEGGLTLLLSNYDDSDGSD